MSIRPWLNSSRCSPIYNTWRMIVESNVRCGEWGLRHLYWNVLWITISHRHLIAYQLVVDGGDAINVLASLQHPLPFRIKNVKLGTNFILWDKNAWHYQSLECASVCPLWQLSVGFLHLGILSILPQHVDSRIFLSSSLYLLKVLQDSFTPSSVWATSHFSTYKNDYNIYHSRKWNRSVIILVQ